MNYIKWIICWWYKTHIYCSMRNKDGNMVRKCVRCGYEE